MAFARAIPAFTGLKPATGQRQSAVAHRTVVRAPAAGRCLQPARASILADPAQLEVRSLDGSSAGSAQLALRVAEDDTQKGLVHRYLVLVQQNARRVSRPACSSHHCSSLAASD